MQHVAVVTTTEHMYLCMGRYVITQGGYQCSRCAEDALHHAQRRYRRGYPGAGRHSVPGIVCYQGSRLCRGCTASCTPPIPSRVSRRGKGTWCQRCERWMHLGIHRHTDANATHPGQNCPDVSAHSPLNGHCHYGAVGGNQCRSQRRREHINGTLSQRQCDYATVAPVSCARRRYF